jgi:hypothetical protein
VTIAKTHTHVGMDFDNTVIVYDDVFYKHAVDLGLIRKTVKKNKQIIRDTIRLLPDGESEWIKLQGLVYGVFIDEAKPAQGVEDFLLICRQNDIEVSIISHKTLYPSLGPKYNLPDAAKGWLQQKKYSQRFGISSDGMIFERSLQGKYDKMVKRECTHFIDDLPEVLLNPKFPKGIIKILYSQVDENDSKEYMCFKDWEGIKKYFFDKRNEHG